MYKLGLAFLVSYCISLFVHNLYFEMCALVEQLILHKCLFCLVMCNGDGTKFGFKFFVKMIGIEDFRKIQKIDFKIGLEVA